MYKELEYFSDATGKAILYQAILDPVSRQSKNTKSTMINGNFVFVENYQTKEFQVKKFESEKQATYAWYDCASKISQLTNVAKQR